MNFRNLLHRIVVLYLVIAVSALLGCGETIEIDRASFSGRVVDEAGNSVAGLALVIIPCDVDDDDTDVAVYDAETNVGHSWVSTDRCSRIFLPYIDENRATGYTVSVEYNGLCATSEDFVHKVGERREYLILKLTGPSK